MVQISKNYKFQCQNADLESSSKIQEFAQQVVINLISEMGILSKKPDGNLTLDIRLSISEKSNHAHLSSSARREIETAQYKIQDHL